MLISVHGLLCAVRSLRFCFYAHADYLMFMVVKSIQTNTVTVHGHDNRNPRSHHNEIDQTSLNSLRIMAEGNHSMNLERIMSDLES